MFEKSLILKMVLIFLFEKKIFCDNIFVFLEFIWTFKSKLFKKKLFFRIINLKERVFTFA